MKVVKIASWFVGFVLHLIMHVFYDFFVSLSWTEGVIKKSEMRTN